MGWINEGFPREIIQYQTSDGQFFNTLEEAQKWEDVLTKKNNVLYTSTLSDSDKSWLENNPKDYWAHKNKNT